MSETKFRHLKNDDLQRLRFLIGLGIMEQLGTMNNRAYVHPITVSIWVGISTIFVTYMNWWPSDLGDTGYLRLLSPIPAFATLAVPMMYFFDWYQRDYFEESVQKAIKGSDMVSPIAYYNQSPASGFFILERKEKIFGFIAIDALKSPTGDSTSQVGNTRGKTKTNFETDEIAVIRHFYLNIEYYTTGVQEDLLKLALSHAFSAKSAPLPKKIRIVDSEVQGYTKAYTTLGFHFVGKDWNGDGPAEWSTGFYGWKFRWLEISREEWEARREEE